MPIAGMTKEQFESAMKDASRSYKIEEGLQTQFHDYSHWSNTENLQLINIKPTNIFQIIGNNHEPLVSVSYEGKVTIHKPELIDDASKIFWDCIMGYFHQNLTCKCCGKVKQ